MGEVVDTRPDLFLTAMEDCGTWELACEKSGLTPDEVETLCLDKDFDLAQVEAQLHYIEITMNTATYMAIETARQACSDNLEKLRQDALQKFRARHER